MPPKYDQFGNEINDAISAAQDQAKFQATGTPKRSLTSYFPAANQFGPVGAAAASGYSNYQKFGQDVAQQNVPVGGFGVGLLNQFGYSRASGIDLTSFLNPRREIPQASGFSGGVGGGQIGFSDKLLLASGVPTRDPGLNLLNGVSPEETAAYWKRIDAR